MNSKDKPMFLGIDDAHNAINSNILKQSMIGQEPRDHEDDGILAASNGKHENGDADYDYSDLGPETDVDAIDDVVAMPVKNLSYDFYKDTDSVHHEDVVAMPVKNLSYEFYKDTEPAHDHDDNDDDDDDQPDNVTNVLDNMDLDESGNANINVNANVMHESIAANNLHENDEDDDEDEEDDDEDEDEDDNDNNVREDNEIRQDLDVSGEVTVSETVHQGEEAEAHVREVIREEMDNKVREQLEGNTDDEETQVKMDDYADDAVDVVDEAAPLDYDESPPSPQANKPLQHALINEADNVADSEDSEDEWNYYRVDPNKEKDSTTPVDETQEARNEEQTQISEPPVDESELKIQPEGIQEDDIKCKSPQEESPELINTEISAEDKTVESEGEEKPCAEEQAKPKDMNFPLNPNAAEFVPGSPQLVDTRMNLVEDYPVSGSPFKQVSQMDDIQVPSQSEFEKEVSQRPREVDVEEKEYQNGDDSQRMDYADFISERQKVIGISANLDDSEISSTKAEYGDESTASFIMTSEFHKTGISTIDESFSSSERDYDIAKDPMAMSFTPSDFEAAFDRDPDLNAVHNLSNTDLDEKNNSMEKEEDLTIEYADLKVESTNLMSTSDVEEPMDKLVLSEEPAQLVNLSCQHEDNEDTLVEHAGESKIKTVELLNLRPQSPQMEQQETARYDHSPSTENYSAEFESEKEPISVDNEQPLSPSSADIDETKPIDEASEDAALPVSDFQKETCSNEADTPSSLSPVPDAMESDLVAPAESAEIQSLLHADAPEFKPGQYSFQPYSTKSSEISEQPSPTETVDVRKTTEQPALDSYEPYPVEAGNAFEPVKQDLAKNLELEEKEIDDELVCAKPPVQESLLDFTEEKDVCTKPPQVHCELTPPLSPQEVEEKVIEDVVCPVESTVVVEQKQEEVLEDKTKEITEAMEELVEPMKAAESMEAVDTLESLSGRTLNLSDSMQEFTGLESQLQPKEDEVPAANVVEDVQEEVAKKEKLINITEPEEPAELVIEETCKIQEKTEVQALPSEVKELEAKEPEVGQFDLKELEMKEPEPKQSEIEQFEVEESKVKDVDAMESEIKETEVVKDIEIKELEFVKEPEIKEMEAAKEPEVKELEIKEPEIKELELKEPEIREAEVKESGIKEPEVKEPKAEEPTIKEPEFKEPEFKEPEFKELEFKEPEFKEPEFKEPEVKEPEVKELEVKEPEVKEPELKEPEVKEPEAKEPEIEVPEVKELEVKELGVMKSEIKEPEVKEPEVREPDVKELEIEEPKIKEPEMVEPEVKEPEVTALEIKETEVKGPEMKEPEIKEPEIKEPEMKEPEVKEPEIKEPEIKEPEIKEPEIKEPEDKKLEIQEPEMKESVEIKEPEVEQKAAEVSEKKVVESAAAAAAIAATAAVAAGAVAAQSKAKAKTTSAKPTKTATLKTTAPKSTPTSPSKTTVSATRTPTTATKKVASSTPTRPKDLDAPKKSPAPSTLSSKPSAPKTASKTTTSTATAKPATRLSAGQVSKPKPATASSKPPVAEKKPTANGDVKSLSKPAASKPPSKTPPPTKTTLVKASTGRMSTGSAPTTKPKPASTGTATKLSTAAKSSTTATTTSTTTTAKPKTSPAVGNAMKTRTSTAKPPIIDKQVKETANKQISMSRTSTGASKVTSRLSAASSATTTPTTKRVTSSPKTTATSPSAKKTISKASKTSTGGKTQTDKGKIVQNGVSEKVEINTIIDDVPKKDLSPMVAPDDNQLIMSSD
ncbi:uncharacterized protein LOC143426346 isoform X4 [Xylocopa sonorina]